MPCVGDQAAVALDHPELAVRRLPQREGQLLDDADGDVVGIAAADVGIGDPIELHQLLARAVDIGAEDRLAGLEAERGEDGFGRRARVAREMQVGDAEAGIVDRGGGRVVDRMHRTPDIAADEQRGDERQQRSAQPVSVSIGRRKASQAPMARMRARRCCSTAACGGRRGFCGRGSARAGARAAARRGGCRAAGRLAVDLHRSHEASSTIQRQSLPYDMPLNAACSGTSDVGVMPGWVLVSSTTRRCLPAVSS